MSMKNPLTPAGIEPVTFRFVAQHLNHWATAVPAAHIINLKTRWRWLGASSSYHLVSEERVPGTHWIDGWVSTRTSLHSLEKRKISCAWWDSDPRLSSPQSTASTDYAAPGAMQVGAYVNGTNLMLPEGTALHRRIFEQDPMKYNNLQTR